MHTQLCSQGDLSTCYSNRGWAKRGWDDCQHACALFAPMHRISIVPAISADALSVQIKDAVGNEYGRPKDIVGETRMAFTSHADAAFDVCFENKVDGHRRSLQSLPMSNQQR